MSQPKTPSGAPQPRRAEPLQPDRPGRGDKQQPGAGEAQQKESDAQRREQEENALENVREGYD